MKSYKTRRAAVEAVGRALGYRGSAGGWIYLPQPEFADHDASNGVPGDWFGSQVCQGWENFDRTTAWHWNLVVEREDGRFTFDQAELEKRLSEAQIKGSLTYAKYLEVLSQDPVSAEAWSEKVDGLRKRVHALHELKTGR